MEVAIGGYFELELPMHEELHSQALALNSGRFCLEYILRCRRYSKVYIPFYTCDSVLEPVLKLGAAYEFYHISSDYSIKDELMLSDGEALIYTNYWGIKSAYCRELAVKYGPKLILDYTQAFFADPIDGIDTFYSCRKFFGVPDGGYLYTDAPCDFELQQDQSFDRMESLIKRIDDSPEAGYEAFRRSSDCFHDMNIRLMSKFTKRMMAAIDYNAVSVRRRENFNYLREHLGGMELAGTDVPMIFPYLVQDGPRLRNFLINSRVFVAKYWPNVEKWAGEHACETKMSDNILPLPVDQRYGIEEMKYIVNLIKEYNE